MYGPMCGCQQPQLGPSFGGGYPGMSGGYPSLGGGFPGMPGMPGMGAGFGVNGGFEVNNSFMGLQMAMMTSLMGMMMQLLQQFGGAGGMLPGTAGFGGPGAVGGGGGGISDFLGAGGAPGGNSGGGGGAPAVGGAGEAPAAGGASAASPVNIGSGTRVLEIGDSHTVGTFGQELDAKLRSTGAQVSTYASAGANPSDFVNGTGHKYGYWEKHADGSEKKVGYGTNAAPPNLEQLIAREKPQVILVNLGANFRGGNPKAEVDKIGKIAKKHNIPLVWVGPPKTREDSSNPSSIQAFDRAMAEAVAPYGKYIPSSNLTPKYSGGDGIHYGGAEGNSIARNWANGVFQQLTGR